MEFEKLTTIENQFLNDRWLWSYMFKEEEHEVGDPEPKYGKYYHIKDELISYRIGKNDQYLRTAMEKIMRWCYDIIDRATPEPVPVGHRCTEHEYWFNGFCTPGYRNNDVVNSMLAYWYIHRDEYNLINNDSQNLFKFDYLHWLSKHTDEDDYEGAAKDKAIVVFPYLYEWTFRYYTDNDYWSDDMCKQYPEYIVYDKCCSTEYTHDLCMNVCDFSRLWYMNKELKVALDYRKERNI